MSSSVLVSAAEARRFLVRRHLLAPPRSLPSSPDEVLAVVARFGSLQFDPLEVPGARNHELVLHARIAGYERGWCERWLYAAPHERRLFEVYNKALNIVGVSEMAAHRFAWERAHARHESGLFKTHAKTVKAVMARVHEHGEVSTRAITKEHGASLDWYWAPTAEGRATLEALFETGRLGIARREGNLRRYDLPERLFLPEFLASRVTREESLRQRLYSRHRALGMLGSKGAPEVFAGTGTPQERARSLASLRDDGSLTAVNVEGVKGDRYVLTTELPWLRDGAFDAGASVSFLAPLDPMVWDRRLLRELFAFDYLWEVYTPEEKRKYGYYALPMLFGDRLVGRVEPRMNRAEGVLVINGVWLEAGFDVEAPGFTRAFGDALEAYRVFVGARTVRFARTKLAKKLRDAIARA